LGQRNGAATGMSLLAVPTPIPTAVLSAVASTPTTSPNLAPIINNLPSSDGTPLWVTLLVGLGGAILGGLVSVGTMWITLKREGERQKTQLEAEERRQLNIEGRAAVAELLGITARLIAAADARPPADLGGLITEMNTAAARVQITCSEPISRQAAALAISARFLDLLTRPNLDVESSRQWIARLRQRHGLLISAMRTELKLDGDTEPVPAASDADDDGSTEYELDDQAPSPGSTEP